jgi:hypothetical protein
LKGFSDSLLSQLRATEAIMLAKEISVKVVATLDRPGRSPESYLPSQAAVESEKRVFVTAITSFAQPRLYPSALPLGLNVKGKFDG